MVEYLRNMRLWAPVPLQSLKFQKLCLFRVTSFLTLRQLQGEVHLLHVCDGCFQSHFKHLIKSSVFTCLYFIGRRCRWEHYWCTITVTWPWRKHVMKKPSQSFFMLQSDKAIDSLLYLMEYFDHWKLDRFEIKLKLTALFSSVHLQMVYLGSLVNL